MGFFADSIYQKFSIRVEIMALRYCVTVLILTLISSTILKIKIKKKITVLHILLFASL